jgi:predicted transcriptional regulator
MSTTMTIRLSHDTKAQLDLLANATRRSKSFLAAEAVAAYVARERAIIEGVMTGLADVSSGNTVPHDMAMAEVDAMIDEIARQGTEQIRNA